MMERVAVYCGKGHVEQLVDGVDMHGKFIMPLRLWRYEDEDIVAWHTNIVRGPKAVAETYWCSEEWKYAPRADGGNTAECSPRTAIENVSHVTAIMQLF